MSRFVLTAQLQLQAPRNTRQVVNQMQQQLQNVNVQINPVINNQALSNANAQLTKVSASAQSVSKNLRGASRSAESFGSALGAAARRFASITLATGFFLGITRAMGSAVGRAVEFEKEMLKISQVTGKSVRGLQALSNEVTNLATTFGVSSEEILGAARTLSQAGLAADQVTKSLRILAQTDLAATFDNIADTTEGAVALINQFRKEVRAAGSEAKFLENALDAINAVSKNFAVESADLISVVRRTGGVFEAAGGKLNELIALFTSVRSTTRETADTIATGFRTIFTRIQRTETIDSLKELGIVLQDTTGKFVGPLEAIKRLSAGLSGLDPRDFRFNEIVEQLGGFRQIGKVIPLIKQYSTSVEALAVANNSMGSTATDAATAQQGLGNQFSQLKEKFDATIRSIADGDTFRSLAEGAIRLAESVLKIVDALEPLMPMLTALAAFKLGQIAVPAFGRFAGIGGKNQGGRIHGFNRGGYVPGTGNRDTVPAMLTPGEFVIRKSSVNKIGASRLAEMNGYANGTTGRGAPRGGVKLNPTLAGAMTADDIAMANAIRGEQGEQANAMAALKAKPLEYYAQPQIAGFATLGGSKGGGRKTYNLGRGGTGYDFNNGFFISGSQLTSADRGIIAKNRGLEPDDVATISSFPARLRGSFSTYTPSHAALTTDGAFQNVLAEGAKAGLEQAFDVGASMLRGSLDLPPVLDVNEDMVANARGASVNDDAALKSIEGYLQEGMISALSGAIPAAGQVGFDLPAASLSGPIKERLGAIYGSEAEATLKAELKRSLGQVSDKQKGLPKKTANDIMAGDLGGIIERFAAGGSAKGSDTIPAMLTPGEYVINKKSAQQIGYGNLNRMNKSGVAKFNTGGPVQHFAFGGGPTSPNPLGAAMSGGGGDPMAGVGQAAKNLVASINTLNNSITAAVDDFAVLQTLDDKIITAIQPFATAINQTAQQIPTVITTMKQSFATASEAVVQSTAAFAQGFSTIDDLIREQLSASTQRIVQGAADFATGLATIDDTLRTSLSSALTAPMTAAAKQLETEMKAFGTELKTKAKIFDTLKDDVETLAKALKTYTTMTTEASDDLGTLKDDITFMAEALMIAGERIIEAGDDLSVLKDDISYLGMAINQTAGQLVENSDDLDILKAPATQMAAGLNKGMSAITHFTGFMGKLNAAIIQMTQNIQAGIAPINMTSAAFADTPQKLTELEMKIEQLEQQLAQVIAAAQKAGINLQNVGVTPVTGGAAAGGAAAGGGMMAGMGNNLMMAGMAAGMLAQSLDGLSDGTKQFIMDLSMIGGMLGMLAMSMHGLVAAGLARLTGEVLNTTAGVVNTGAKVANTGAINQNTAAQMLNTRAGAAAGGILTGLTIALTYTIMRSKALGEQAKELGKEFESSMKDLKESGVGVSLEQAQAKIGAALQKEAEARESMVGGIIGTIAGVVAAVAFVAAGIASGGTLFLATAAIVATAGIAGAEMGASFATASEATAGAADLLVASTYHASQGLGQLAVATKQMELEQLEGMDLLRRQSATFEKFHTSSLKATAAFNAFQNLDAGLSGEMREDMDASDVFEDVREQGVDAMKEMAQALFQEAQNLRKGISGAVEEMAKTGASVDEIFANKDIQKGFQDLGSAINQALTIQMLMTGQMKNEAKARMGLVGVMESEMSIAQRKQLIELESQLIQQEANKTSKDAVEAEKKRHRERLEAEAKERAAAEQKLRSDIALARASFAAAQAVDLFAAEMLNFGGTLDMVMLEFGALTGSVKQYKTQNDKLIGSLATGTITPEAEAAAMQTADQFGVQAETAKLLNNIKETERIRKVLTEKGLEEFDNNLNETASNLKIEKFLTDNNIDLSGLDADVRAEILKFFEDGLQPGEIEEIIDMVNSENESQIKVLQELAKAHNQYLGALFKFGDAVIKVENEMVKSFSRIVDVQLKGAERIAQAQGRDLTRAEVAGAAEAKRNAPLQAAGLVGGGVQATEIQLQRKRQRQQQIAAEIKIRADKGQTEEVIKLQNEQKKLNNQTKLLKDNLKALADQADLAAAVMGEIEKERGRIEGY